MACKGCGLETCIVDQLVDAVLEFLEQGPSTALAFRLPRGRNNLPPEDMTLEDLIPTIALTTGARRFLAFLDARTGGQARAWHVVALLHNFSELFDVPVIATNADPINVWNQTRGQA